MRIFGRIKQLTKEKNSSISQIERQLKLGNGTIRRWDTNAPSADKVLAVADLLNVSVEYLMTGEDKKKATHFNNNEKEYILDKARNLSDEDFRTLTEIINAFSKER